MRTKFKLPEKSIFANQAKSPIVIMVCAPATDQGEKKAKPQRENQMVFSAAFIAFSLVIMKNVKIMGWNVCLWLSTNSVDDLEKGEKRSAQACLRSVPPLAGRTPKQLSQIKWLVTINLTLH